MTKRQSIKLLGEILLDRANYQVMTAYVDRGENLKLCMNLLKDERKMVQYEGFHIFKVCPTITLIDTTHMAGRIFPTHIRMLTRRLMIEDLRCQPT